MKTALFKDMRRLSLIALALVTLFFIPASSYAESRECTVRRAEYFRTHSNIRHLFTSVQPLVARFTTIVDSLNESHYQAKLRINEAFPSNSFNSGSAQDRARLAQLNEQLWLNILRERSNELLRLEAQITPILGRISLLLNAEEHGLKYLTSQFGENCHWDLNYTDRQSLMFLNQISSINNHLDDLARQVGMFAHMIVPHLTRIERNEQEHDPLIARANREMQAARRALDSASAGE